MRRGVFVLLLFAGGCVGFLAQRPDVVARIPLPAPEAEVKRDGDKTLAYWKALHEILNKERTIRSPEPPSELEGFRYVVKHQVEEIQDLAVLDVDQEVLALSGRLVTLLRQTGEGIGQVRWYHGLGWPLPQELTRLDANARLVRKEMEDLRPRLTQRYRLDFPPLQFCGGFDRP